MQNVYCIGAECSQGDGHFVESAQLFLGRAAALALCERKVWQKERAGIHIFLSDDWYVFLIRGHDRFAEIDSPGTIEITLRPRPNGSH